MSASPAVPPRTSRTQGETIALTVALLVIGGAGVYFLQDLLGPAFFALTLVITVRPLVAWASRHHVPRPVSAVAAIVIVHTVVLALVAALGVLGVPMAVTWGLRSFITNYIPNIGFFVGLIPPALLALVDSGPWTALWVIVAYVVLNFVIQTLIQPKFTGDAVGLNTTTTFLSLMFWSQVIGALGTILAVPLTLFVKAMLIDSDPRARWVSIFLSAGDNPVPAPETMDVQTLDKLDLDGDGVGEEDPKHGLEVVEQAEGER